MSGRTMGIINGDQTTSYLSLTGASASPVLLAKQLRQNGVKAVWLGSPSTAGTETLKRAGADLNGAYAVTDFAAQATPRPTTPPLGPSTR
jgi:ABC-type branched-subunit amino acid transport system substrate-binding protein